MATIKLRRGTKANLDVLAASSGLLQGEPYFLTDKESVAVGTTASTYSEMAISGRGSCLWKILSGETVTVGERQEYAVCSGLLVNQGAIDLGEDAILFVGV